MAQARRLMSSFDRALGWLTMRDHSEAEIRRKLKQKKIPEEDHETVMQRLIDGAFLDDTRFFESRCRSLLGRGQGRNKILQDIRSRGVAWDETKFREIESELRGETGGAEVLEALVEKKMRESRLQKKFALAKSDRNEMRKLEQSLLRALLQKGFSAGEGIKTIRAWISKSS